MCGLPEKLNRMLLRHARLNIEFLIIIQTPTSMRRPALKSEGHQAPLELHNCSVLFGQHITARKRQRHVPQRHVVFPVPVTWLATQSSYCMTTKANFHQCHFHQLNATMWILTISTNWKNDYFCSMADYKTWPLHTEWNVLTCHENIMTEYKNSKACIRFIDARR